MSAGIIGRRNSPHRRPRRMAGQVRIVNPTPISVTTVTASGNNLIVSFNGPVSLKGVPRYLKNGTIVPTSASLTALNQTTVVYPAGGLPSNVVIGFEDPAVRNNSGGYVNAGTYTIAAEMAGEGGEDAPTELSDASSGSARSASSRRAA